MDESGASGGPGKGKGKAKGVSTDLEEQSTQQQQSDGDREGRDDAAPGDDVEGGSSNKNVQGQARPLVVFACRHIWHKDCLEIAMKRGGLEVGSGAGGKEFRCPAEHSDGERNRP